MLGKETPHTVCIILHIHPSLSGTSSLWEYEQILPCIEEGITLHDSFLHLLSIPSSLYRYTLCEIAKNNQCQVFLEVPPFREIPGYGSVKPYMIPKGIQTIRNNKGIDEG